MTVAPVAIELAEFGGKSPRRLFWERFRQDKAAIAGGVVVVLLVLTAMFGGPLSAGDGPSGEQHIPGDMTDDFGVPKGPNSKFWFGVDSSGRDLFVRTIYGARTSLIVGVVASRFA